MRLRLASLFFAIALSALVIALVTSNQRPKEVRRILRALPDIQPDNDLETVANLLIRPERKPDGGAMDRPDTNPRYYIRIDDEYRLVLDVTRTISNEPDGTKLIGNHVFDGAHVEKRTHPTDNKWEIIYPARSKTEMVYSGRK